MKFDVVIGNPPYQNEIEGTSDSPIYHYFFESAIKIADKVILISPARFLFNAGKTPKNWNNKMLEDKHLKVVFYSQNSSKIFRNTDIKGGIAITYIDQESDFGPIGTFTVFSELNSILDKVVNQSNFKSIMDFIFLQTKFDLENVYADFPKYKSIIGSEGKEKRLTTPIFSQLDFFEKSKLKDDDIEIIGLINNKREKRFISIEYLEVTDELNKYKVIIPKSNGSGAIGEVISTPLIGEPLIGFTQSFIGVGPFNTNYEANSCLKYIKGKFSRVLLGTLKITQDNSKPVWANVPLQDFTSTSDIDWKQSVADVDKQLYKKYGLSQEEIDFIETKVKEME